MTEEDMLIQINIGIAEIINESEGNFGKIELVVKSGEVKHVNVSYEISLAAKKRYFHPTIPSENTEK